MALRCIAQVMTDGSTELTLVDGTQTQPLHLKSLIICEQAGAAATFRIRLALQSANSETKQRLYHNCPVVPNDSFTLALDIGMLSGDRLFCFGSTANLSVNLFAE